MGRARWLDAAIGVALVGLAAVGLLRWVDTTAQSLVVLQTAGPFVVLGLVLLTAVTLVLRRWWMLVPIGLACVVAATVALPGFFADSRPDTPKDLTVMTVNLRFGNADAAQVMDAVRARDVDVLITTELTPEARSALSEAGARRWFPEQEGRARADSFTGTMVWSRFPLTPVTGTDSADEHTPSLQPEVVVNVSGTPVRVKAAHPIAPLDGDTEAWRSGLRALAAWKDRQPRGERFLIAGDFNASHGHPAFRDLAEGLDDAQVTAGQGWIRTWPVVGRRLPPYVQLDHVLSRGLTVVEAGQTAIHGTDHTLVWASYATEAAAG